MRTLRSVTPALALPLAGCAAPPGSDPASRGGPQPLPSQLRLVGEPGPGAAISGALAADGVSASSGYAGRAEGIRDFCSGAADGVALSSDLTDGEREECRTLGGEWSALSGPGGTILHVDHSYADALIEASAAF